MNLTSIMKTVFILGLSLPSTLNAKETFEFDFIRIGHVEDVYSDRKGYEVELSKDLGENFILNVEYLKHSNSSSSSLRAEEEVSLGLGYSFNIDISSVLLAQIDYVKNRSEYHSSLDDRTFNREADGGSLKVAYFRMITDDLSFKVEQEYYDIGIRHDNTLSLGVEYSFSDEISLGFEHSKNKDDQFRQIFFKYAF